MDLKLSEATKINHDLKCINAIESRLGKFLKQAKYSEKPGYYKNKINWEFGPILKTIEKVKAQKRGNNNKTYLLKQIRKFYNKMPPLKEHYALITKHLCKKTNKIVQGTYKTPKPKCTVTEKTLQKLNLQKNEARRYNWVWRTTMELTRAHVNQYYAIFNTLTLEAHNVEKVFQKGSQAFQNYIKNINVLTNNKHRYFAVRERGKEGQLHIHTIHVITGPLPSTWTTDPNYGLPVPYRREIHNFKHLWTYGFSTPIAIRYSNADPWAKLGWRWPTDREGNPKEITAPVQMARYLGKYLKKQDHDEEKEKWPTKRTQNWGMESLDNILNKLPNKDLETIRSLPTTRHLKLAGIPIPKTLLQRRILLIWKRRTNPSLNQLMDVPARPNIITLTRTSMQGVRTSNLSNVGSFDHQRLKNTDISNLIENWANLAKMELPIDFTKPNITLKGSSRLK